MATTIVTALITTQPIDRADRPYCGWPQEALHCPEHAEPNSLAPRTIADPARLSGRRHIGVEARCAEIRVVQEMVVAKADRGWENDGDIGEDRAEPVGVRGPEHQVVRVIVDQHEQCVIGECADRIGRDDDDPPVRTEGGKPGADGQLHGDQQHRPQSRSPIALEERSNLGMVCENLLSPLPMRDRHVTQRERRRCWFGDHIRTLRQWRPSAMAECKLYAFGSFCLASPQPASSFDEARSISLSASRIEKILPPLMPSSSSQAMGAATGAPSRARAE